LLVLAAIFLIFQYRTIRNDLKQRQSLRDKLNNVDASEYLPRTEQEVRWFILVSISAGICEELLFRGFLIWYFKVFSVTALAVVCSSVLFGILHSYQGWKGGLRTGVVGLVLALSYVLTGSLWIPILLHIVVDIHSGMLGWLAFEENKQVESA
jgi:membrane protease YdiL (CAAX protease family)